MKSSADVLTIAEVARRSGTTTATLRFYESRGLIEAARSAGNHRRYSRHVLRRVAVIRTAQRLGLTLDEIGTALGRLPAHSAPTKAQWAAMSRRWQADLTERIEAMTRLRDSLSDCIGCGCLSVTSCPIYNPQDALGERGPGARRWLGDRLPDEPAHHDV